jgi:hypothetical protein
MLEEDYRELLTVSKQMLSAAESSDWNTVEHLNRSRELIVRRMAEFVPPLDEAVAARIADTISSILKCDREIRARAEHLLGDTANLLRAFNTHLHP